MLLGRESAAKGGVDVDLSREGSATKVSRRQAYLSLQPDGSFRIDNIGRQTVVVDGVRVEQFSGSPVGQLSVIEVGGARLMFMINGEAVKRILRRSARLAV